MMLLAVAGGIGVIFVLDRYAQTIPDHTQLAVYEPPTVTRIHAGDGRLLSEYAYEKRVFVPIEAIPDHVKQAFIAAEDKNFYSHAGVDPLGIARATVENIKALREGGRPQGASTITQQVAKNFLLSNELSLERKLKEALLAMRMERTFDKDHILELYLNEIFLGRRSYGVAAAALNYFDKSLEELTVAEAAYLAGLPKAPSHYDPVREPQEAKARRNYVLRRMTEDGVISEATAQSAAAEPLIVRERATSDFAEADFFTEEVRRELVGRFGEDPFYESGLSVRSTVEPTLQAIADRVLREGLAAYDRRTDWRGALDHIDTTAVDWQTYLEDFDPGFDLINWHTAVVHGADDGQAEIGLADGSTGIIPFAHLRWARTLDGEVWGPEVKSAAQVLSEGDIILVEELDQDGDSDDRLFALRQIPQVEGALVALDPHTGRILAMSGGFSFRQSKFNRATQARRQPGSSFKPFVYLAAMEQGFTPASIVLDAPIVIEQGGDQGKWKPGNYSDRFYGPSTLRLGMEKSRNLMTVRLAQDIGMRSVQDVARRFNIANRLGANLASALGSNEITLLELTTAYAMLVNGGKRIEPRLIDRIQDQYGRTVAQPSGLTCADCQMIAWDGEPPQPIPDHREQIVDPRHAFQVVHMLEGVVERGTAIRANTIGKPLAGKTGTTNESRDAWFVGFSPDLAVGVYVGYDKPKTLGKKQTGSSVALPIWIDFMKEALADQPATPFRTAPGLRHVRIDARSGKLAGPSSEVVISEAFMPGTEPTEIERGRSIAVNADRDDGPVLPADTTPSTSGLY